MINIPSVPGRKRSPAVPAPEIQQYRKTPSPRDTTITSANCASVAQSSDVTDNGGTVLHAPTVGLLFWGNDWVTGNPTYSMTSVTDALDRACKSSLMTGLAPYRDAGGVGSSVVATAVINNAYSNNGIDTPGDPPTVLVNGTDQPGFEASIVPDLIYNALIEGLFQSPLPDIICVIPPGNTQNVNQNQDGSYSITGSWGQHWYENPIAGWPTGFYLMWINQAQDIDSLSWIFTHELCESCSNAAGNAISVSNYQPPTSDQGDKAGEICDICQGFSVRLNGINVTSYWSDQVGTCITPYYSWIDLPGETCGANSGVACISNQDQRLEVFMIGPDSNLWHNWQVTPGGYWSGWSNLAVPNPGYTPIGAPAVARNADGRLEVFITDGQTVAHIWQVEPNSGWSTWQDLGGPSVNGVAQPIQYGVSVANNADGRIEFFVVAGNPQTGNGELWHMWQTQPSAAPWSSWSAFPPSSLVSLPVIVNNQDGRLEAFAVSLDGTLAHIWQVVPNGGWSTWSSLGNMGSALPGRPVAVGSNQDGRLEAFTLDGNGALWHIWQVVPNGGWSGWQSLHRPAVETALTSSPATFSNADGRIEVFVQDQNGNLWQIWQTAPNSGWSVWSCLSGGTYDSNLSGIPPAPGRNWDGRLEVFAVRNDLVVGHEWQVSAGSAWVTQNMVSNCYS